MSEDGDTGRALEAEEDPVTLVLLSARTAWHHHCFATFCTKSSPVSWSVGNHLLSRSL